MGTDIYLLKDDGYTLADYIKSDEEINKETLEKIRLRYSETDELKLHRQKLNGENLKSVYENSQFLKDFKKGINQKTKGCVLMEDPLWLKDFAIEHNAFNTSNRKDFLEQLANSPKICSHGSCKQIPEKHWIYRMAKKRAFFGLGAYG